MTRWTSTLAGCRDRRCRERGWLQLQKRDDVAIFSNVTYPIGTIAIITLNGLTATVQSIIQSVGKLNGIVNTPTQQATFTVGPDLEELAATALDTAGAILFQGDNLYLFSNTPLTLGQQITFTETNFGDYQVPCFVAGTRILTRRGEVAVEELEVGDYALALGTGGFSMVTWIGQRRLEWSSGYRQPDKWPLRVREGAFGEGRPHRDLYLSPDHAVHFDGALIPVRYLENGITVLRAPMEDVTYFHVELQRHDLLLAEGLAAESYLDTGNRQDFAGAARPATLAEHDERVARHIWAEKSCLPLHVGGPVVVQARAMLARRAVEMGLGLVAAPELRLRVDGRDILPTRFGDGWHFELPQMTTGAKLQSIAHVPAVTGRGSSDHRCLGVPVTRMMVDGKLVSPDATFLRRGWHQPEDGLRWTNGLALLPPLRTLTLLLAPIMPGGDGTQCADAREIASAA